MLRKSLLVIMAAVLSYVLTALAAYVLYLNSEGRSEALLSIWVRYVISPIIAMLIGTLIGLLSKEHSIAISILGLMPWTIMLLSGPQKPASVAGWASWLLPLILYLPLGAAAAYLGYYWRRKGSNQTRSLA